MNSATCLSGSLTRRNAKVFCYMSTFCLFPSVNGYLVHSSCLMLPSYFSADCETRGGFARAQMHETSCEDPHLNASQPLSRASAPSLYLWCTVRMTGHTTTHQYGIYLNFHNCGSSQVSYAFCNEGSIPKRGYVAYITSHAFRNPQHAITPYRITTCVLCYW